MRRIIIKMPQPHSYTSQLKEKPFVSCRWFWQRN